MFVVGELWGPVPSYYCLLHRSRQFISNYKTVFLFENRYHFFRLLWSHLLINFSWYEISHPKLFLQTQAPQVPFTGLYCGSKIQGGGRIDIITELNMCLKSDVCCTTELIHKPMPRIPYRNFLRPWWIINKVLNNRPKLLSITRGRHQVPLFRIRIQPIPGYHRLVSGSGFGIRIRQSRKIKKCHV